ncbi:MAG: CxxxxCH/CxxCH domain-containing protein, partial [Deltaproteobacteria bacterium]|nr:CxxxxCH/CxxCH domain-containing protein [Deltaproteobacteria bacterium]
AGGAHLNAVNDVAFHAAYDYEGAAGSRTGTGAATTCASVRCHNGVTTPGWAAASTIACGQCHNTGGTGPVPTGAGVAGSHAAHAQNVWPTPTCDACHGASGVTVSGTYTATGGGGAGKLHQNLTVEVWINGAANRYVDAANTAGGVNWNVAGATHVDDGTCSTTVCHGAGTPVWGGTLPNGCADCHFRANAGGGDSDNWSISDRIASLIDSDQWAYSGHGKASGTYDGQTANPAAAFGGPVGDPMGCRYCHSTSVLHGDATNPFRLANKNVLARPAPSDGGWNDNCLTCHKSNDAGYVAGTGYAGGYNPTGYATKNAQSNVDEAHHGGKHAANTAGGNFCWDCHDPHGDRLNSTTGNLVMIQGSVAKASNGTEGIPATTVAAIFTANATGTDYAQNGATPTGVCNVCHTTTGHYTSDSGDGHQSTTRCTNCHKHEKEFGATCDACHIAGNTVGAPVVVWPAGNRPSPPAGVTGAAYGSHLVALTTDALSGTTDWTAQCSKCHSGHSGSVLVPLPPASYTDGVGTTGLNMRTVLGINYTATGGIHLGGTATAGATEAELCWNCHYDNNLSNNAEFGVNNNANTGSMAYNYGTLSTWNATRKGAWWEVEGTTPAAWHTAQTASPSFGYKDRTLQSMHAANLASPAQGLKLTSTIRCSYCHDVHDRNQATRTTGKGTYADALSGPPFLRGTWKGNPYPEDGGPQSTSTYVSDKGFGPMPRSSALTTAGAPRNQLGGYQIDQNNANPTTGGLPAHINPAVAAWQVSAQAGLCVLCHSDSVDTMNQLGNPADDWIGPLLNSANSSTATPNLSSNGHANSAIGGTGASAPQASNIYDELIRNQTNKPFTTGATPYRAGAPAMALRQLTNAYRPSSLRSTWRGFGYLPAADYRARAYWNYDWGATVNGATLDNQYHKFPCSKCHAPHASQLPRLLLTNCLDVKHATWGASYGVYGPAGTTNTYAGASWPISVENGSVNNLNSTAAQNCHRLPNKVQFPNALGLGWNRVSPW